MNKMAQQIPPVLTLLLLGYCQLGHSAAQTGGTFCTVDTSSEYGRSQGRFYRENVPEDLPPDSELMTLVVHGGDQVTLSIKDGEGDERVKLNDSNILRVDKPLGSLTDAAGNIRNIELQLNCENRGQKVELAVIITVLQVNDNPPEFIGAPYVGNISEMALVGSPVFTGIRAQDKDGDTLFYTILPGPYSTHFWFPNVGQGTVALNKPIDYENVTEVVLTICAKDSSSSQGFNATTTLTVRVLDGDDQNPEFVDGPYKAYLMEGESLNAIVPVTPQLYAIDPDVNINSPISYSILHDSDETEYFKINEQTGEVRLQKDALRRGDRLTFLVKASQRDNPDRFATSLVRVIIQAANENPPKFVDKEYNVELVENVPVGSTVARLEAVDNDMEGPLTIQLPVSQSQGSVLTFSFEPNQDAAKYFSLDSEKGIVTTSQSLSPLSAQTVRIKVRVTDGQYSDLAEVVVTVADVNDHSPAFPQDSMTYDLDTREQGTVIARVVATDSDPDTVITYAFLGNVTKFTVSPSTGEIVLVASEKEELSPAYTLVVQASDDGSPPRHSVIVVHVSFGADTGGVVSGGGESPGYLLIIVIVLGVLSAILLTGIIVLLVMLYRNSCKDPENKPVRSQSFEKNLNFASKDYKSYMDQQQNPSGITYKPTGRHMEIYDAVHLDEDSTQTAQNPFHQGNDTYPPRHQLHAPLNQRVSAASSSNSPYSIDGVTQSSTSVSRQMVEVNEIDYETAVAPLDDMLDHKGMYEDSDSMGSSSGGGGGGGRGAGGYRMGGSTQKLVSSSAKGHKKAAAMGESNLSFIDSPMNSLYSSNNSQIGPNAAALGSQDRPGITIYY